MEPQVQETIVLFLILAKVTALTLYLYGSVKAKQIENKPRPINMSFSHPILSLNHITVRHQNHMLFQDLTFLVNKGEHWALVGESGSGKSTLLKTIAGSYSIAKGHVEHHYFKEFQEQHPQDDPLFTYHNLVAEVSQKHDFRNLSNQADFYYQQRYHSQDSEDAPTVQDYLSGISPSYIAHSYWSYEKVVATFQLEALLQKQLIKLSNGETKRLLLAAALRKHPKLLLLDNPLTGLDVQTRLDLDAIIAEIAASGITIIMATSPTEIPDVITHVAVLQEGKIVRTVPKSVYHPDLVHLVAHVTPDEEELQELLASEHPEVFHTIVHMQDVSIRYGDKQVLSRINWHVKAGERWALLGKNGAGKTTLLSLVNGDNPQSYAQKITLFDKKRGSGESIWDIKRRIGFVSPELYQYFPYHNTCLQVIESGFYDTLGLTRPSEPAKAAEALRWMQLLGIEQEANKQVKQVAASVQRLCLLARALVKCPPLLILDEPCQGLDPKQQKRFKQLLEAICTHSDTTIIYVTHYQEDIPACINHVLHLEAGKVNPAYQLVE
ncbi:ATP-binding cassette domain-containing protein [Pontibacter sp. SGAir0037]|uniref:ATP-binding cassette domain-containing protein n=1 Tax=Pontibacter sp. SGAir0037 TaxID=2571030 RepID=UPI001980C290|nr:ATP-binding cassette domain-containing protein [Pontibacter sp. SGAir0037]